MVKKIKTAKKAKKKVAKTKSKATKKKPKGQVCSRYNGIDMCYRCLDLARSLLLSEDLHEDELKK